MDKYIGGEVESWRGGEWIDEEVDRWRGGEVSRWISREVER